MGWVVSASSMAIVWNGSQPLTPEAAGGEPPEALTGRRISVPPSLVVRTANRTR